MVRSFSSVKTKDDYTAPVSNGLYRFWQEDGMRKERMIEKEEREKERESPAR